MKEGKTKSQKNWDTIYRRAINLFNDGLYPESATIFLRLLTEFPREPNFLRGYGTALLKMNRLRECAQTFERLIQINPTQVDILQYLALIYDDFSEHEKAISYYEKVIGLVPHHAEAHSNRGNSLSRIGRNSEAVHSYDNAIRYQPNFAEAYFNRANTLNALGDFLGAIESYDQAIAIKPDYFDAYLNLTLPLCALKLFDRALLSTEKALELRPSMPVAHVHHGIILKELGRHEEALMSHTRAIQLKPHYAEAYCNRAVSYTEISKTVEALDDLDRAILINPLLAEAHWNKSLVLIVTGAWVSGWELYEWRFERLVPETIRRYQENPLLPTSKLKQSDVVFIYAEQGLGDTIMFSRFCKMLADTGAKVILEVQNSIQSLLESLDSRISVIPRNKSIPKYDYQLPLMSLPWVLGTTTETIPYSSTYLSISDFYREKWSKRLGFKNNVRIGLACSGNLNHKNDHKRSVPFTMFEPLFHERREIHCVQQEVRASDAVILKQNPEIRVHCEHLDDFSDTAALLEQMDLIITVDTSIAHLAGAMGKPVWILLSYAPDYRWLLDTSDTPWYTSATLFRQGEDRDWASVISNIHDHLQRLGL